MNPLIRRIQLHLCNHQIAHVGGLVAKAKRSNTNAQNLEAQKTQLEIARDKLLKGGAL